MNRVEMRKLKLAGINIPKGTPLEKKNIIEIGLQLMTLNNQDVLKILDKNTGINEAERILRDGRLSGELKCLTYEYDSSKEIEDELEME